MLLGRLLLLLGKLLLLLLGRQLLLLGRLLPMGRWHLFQDMQRLLLLLLPGKRRHAWEL